MNHERSRNPFIVAGDDEMKYCFSSPRSCKLRRFFKRSPMDTSYDDRPAIEMDALGYSDKSVDPAGIDEHLAN